MKIIDAVNLRFCIWKLFFKGNISFLQACYLIMPAFLRSENDVKVKLFDKPFIVPLGKIGEFHVLMEQIVSLNQYRVGLIRSKSSIFDAGANLGIFSIYVAVKYPDSIIYAFEPTPTTFSALKENVKYYPNIKVFNYALGEAEGNSSIIVMPNSGSNHIGEGGIPVKIKTIDSTNFKIDFLKIDVEGYEANVLNGAKETIRKYKPVIVMSAYHKENDKEELPRILKGIYPDYVCELNNDGEEVFICTAKDTK